MSQDKQLFEGFVLEISLPTYEGSINIYPDHTELITLLDIGKVSVKHAESKEELHILIKGGLAYVKDNEILILAEEAVLPHELTAHEIEKAINNAMEEISGELPPAVFIQLEKQLKFAMFKKSFLEDLKK